MRIQGLFLLVLLTIPVCGQELGSAKPPDKSNVEKPGAEEMRAAAKAKEQFDEDLIRAFALRVNYFGDPVWKITTNIALAESLRSRDPVFSTDLLRRTYDFAKDLKPIPLNATRSNRAEVISWSQIEALQREVLEAMYGRNNSGRGVAQLARDRGLGEVVAAAGGVKEAVQMVEESIREGVHPEIINYLLNLRQQDAGAADSLYVEALNRLIAEPSVDPQALLYFGYYPFQSGNSTAQSSQAMVTVDGTGVWNIGGHRQGMSGDIIRAYLTVSAEFLTRAPQSSIQSKVGYLAAYELGRQALYWAPDLVPIYSEIMGKLSAGVPQSLVSPAGLDALKSSRPKDTGDLIKEIDDTFDEALHDELCISGVMTAVGRQQWKEAHVLADKISVLNVRAQVLPLMDYFEARASLKTGKSDFAVRVAERLPPTIARPLLQMEIVRWQMQKGDPKAASAALYKALKDARNSDSDQKPYLLLRIASEFSDLDASAAVSVFSEAVLAFNNAPLKLCSWTISVNVLGRPPAQFDLLDADQGGRNDFATAVERIYAIDPSWLVGTVLSMKDEPLISRGMTTIAAVILKSKAKATPTRK